MNVMVATEMTHTLLESVCKPCLKRNLSREKPLDEERMFEYYSIAQMSDISFWRQL